MYHKLDSRASPIRIQVSTEGKICLLISILQFQTMVSVLTEPNIGSPGLLNQG